MIKNKEWLKKRLAYYEREVDYGQYKLKTRERHNAVGKVDAINKIEKFVEEMDEPEQVVPSKKETTTAKQDDAIWFEDMAKEFGVTIMETVVIPEMISEYIEKEKGKNILGNIAEEIYNNSTSWSRLTPLQKWLRLNFTLFAKAWITENYTIEKPKLLTVIVKDYGKTTFDKQLPEDEVEKMMEGMSK